jgi:hypothetical protein
MENKNNNPEMGNQMEIELPEDIADGMYCNLAVITHSNTEFILDMIRVVPGAPKAKVKSRIIMTPHHAKRLLGALNDNMRKYEEHFGEVEVDNNPIAEFPMNFGGPTGEA